MCYPVFWPLSLAGTFLSTLGKKVKSASLANDHVEKWLSESQLVEPTL